MGLLDGFFGLGRDINKVSARDNAETREGITSDIYPELTLEMKNEDIVKLTEKWARSWTESETYRDFMKKSEENEKYWKGEQHVRIEADKSRAMVDNVIFEGLETYLPQITRRNPEGTVAVAEHEDGTEPTKDEQAFATSLKKKLNEVADEVSLRLKLKKAGRHWAIYLLGALQMGWDMDKNIPTAKAVRARRLILDPNSTIDEDGYTGKFLGKHRDDMDAAKLLLLLRGMGGEPDGIKAIEDLVKENKGTNVAFIEWWTDEYTCWTLGKHVLFKKKNFHWNYDTKQDAPADDQGIVPQNPDGTTQQVDVPGVNHLARPQIPFVFLSVFNLGTRPIDDTSLIGQNLSNQDIINKRNKQIDKNADGMNGGLVISGERSGLTKEQAKDAARAVRNGGAIWVPSGDAQNAVYRDRAPSLPADIYNQAVDLRGRIRDIFGTRGSTPAGTESESTVRGKILNRTSDTDRIGGGISEVLEQVADKTYNWWAQMLYVYDAAYRNMPNKPKVKISVKEGSLLPKDSVTIANQAIDLASSGKMSTVDLYKKLDYPNPEELAANAWLETNAPELLFPNDERVQRALQAKQAAAGAGAQKPPSTSISFKDLPPEGQSQLAKQAGIDLHPEAIAVHNASIATDAAPPTAALPSETTTAQL